MNKLDKEIEIISALIAGKIVSTTGTNHTYKYKIEASKLLYLYGKEDTWTKSIFTSFKDLDFKVLQTEEQSPKFKLGQEVWFMNDNKATNSYIIDVSNAGTYTCKVGRYNMNFTNADLVFVTKQELLQSL